MDGYFTIVAKNGLKMLFKNSYIRTILIIIMIIPFLLGLLLGGLIF